MNHGTHAPLTSHTPVMANEVLQILAPHAAGRYIDATAGGGGHSWLLLRASLPDGRVLSLDADPMAVERVRSRLAEFGARSVVVQANFRQLEAVAVAHGFTAVDGLLMDLGLSSDQLANTRRGFSLMEDGPLDMRFDPASPVTAADLVNNLTASDLADLLFRYGDERFSRRIAKAIVAARPIRSTSELARIVSGAVGRRESIHPATRTFQALRIAVNDELGALSDALPQAVELLRPGGRLVVVSFHSLEDRIVKEFMRREAQDCLCPPDFLVCTCGHKASVRVLTKKPITPSADEVAENPRSRSAKLRAAEKLTPS